MKRMRGRRGQTTVFLCIVLIGVTYLSGVLVDAARVMTGRAQVKRAAAASAKSLAAGYSTRLKEEYGVFALEAGPEKNLEGTALEYMRDNLGCGRSDGSVDLYGFRVEEVKITPIFNLSENEVARQQILEYMKFRGPKELVRGFADRLDAVKQSGRMAGAYKRKISVDKLLGKMGGHQEALKRDIDGKVGTESGEKYFISGFSPDGARGRLVSELSKMAEAYLDCLEEREAVQERIEAASRSSGAGSGGTDEEEERSELDRLKKKRSELGDKLSELKGDIRDALNALEDVYTAPYLKSNRSALDNIRKIIEYGEKAREAVRSLEEFMGAGEVDGASLSADFQTVLSEDLLRVRELILDGGRAEELTAAAEGNIKVLEEALDNIAGVKRMLGREGLGGLTGVEASQLLNDGLEGYVSDLAYNYLPPSAADGGGRDMRKEKAGEAETLLETVLGEDISFEAAGIDIELLPSRSKLLSDENGIAVEHGNAGDTGAAEDGFGLPETGGGIDLHDKEGAFAENAFGFLEALGGAVGDRLSGLRDELYINEYIMGIFKSSATGAGGETEYDLRGLDKTKRNAFFNSEVEYIINGSSSERVNRNIVKTEVLLVRFALNTLHVYTDGKKTELSRAVAAAVSGWWSAGAAVPIVSHLIRCGWGLGEAILDLEELMEGKSVPFYKLKGDWRLDVGIPGDDGPKSDARLAFSYQDYLRLFLLLQNPDVKMSRLEDLIQVNIQKSKPGFAMSGCHTYVKLEAVVSMKYLFITGSFMPPELKTADGRHLYSVEIFDGYW